MPTEALKVREVTWYIPQSLYDALSELQAGLVGPTTTPRWGSVEALATHFLGIAVRETYKEIQAKQRAQRLVLLPGELPK